MGGEEDEEGGNGQRLGGKSGIGEGREGIGDLRNEVRIIGEWIWEKKWESDEINESESGNY